MNSYNEIKKNIELLRKSLQKIGDKLLKQSPINYNIFCASMDIIEDSMLGIENYIEHGLGKDFGEKYLKLYGLMQAVIIQQDAIKEIYKIFEINYKYKNNSKDIRHLRNKIAGHPVDYNRGEFVTSLSRAEITDKTLGVFSYNKNKNKNKDEIDEIDYYSLLQNYLDEANDCIEELIEIVNGCSYN